MHDARLLLPLTTLLLATTAAHAVPVTEDFEAPGALSSWTSFAYEGEDGGPYTPSASYSWNRVNSTPLASWAGELNVGNLGSNADDRALALFQEPRTLWHPLQHLSARVSLETIQDYGVCAIYFCCQSLTGFDDTYVLWLYKNPGADQIAVKRWVGGVSTALTTQSAGEFAVGAVYDIDVDLLGDQITVAGPNMGGSGSYSLSFTDGTFTTGTFGVGVRNAGLETSTRCEFDDLAATYGNATYSILPAGSGDFPTIQAGVNGAFTGDILSLGSGTFTGAGNRDVDLLDRNLVIRGAAMDATACILDLQASPSDEARGLFFHGGQDTTAVIEFLTIRNGYKNLTYVAPDSSAGGAIFARECGPMIRHCIIENCTGNDAGGIAFKNAVGGVIRNNEVRYNAAHDDVGGIAVFGSSSGTLVENNFVHHNLGPSTAGGGSFRGDVVVRNNVFVYNRTDRADHLGVGAGVDLGAGLTAPTGVVFHNNTVAFDSTNGHGGAVRIDPNASPDINHCIFAFNYGELGEGAVYCSAGASPTVSCCAFFGNDPDDSFCGVDGGGSTFGLDPLFCDALSGDFSLRRDSPCAGDGSCGLIGALGVGCRGDAPFILSVLDVPNDQGRQVRLTWESSRFDAHGSSQPITGYAIWRQIEAADNRPVGLRSPQPGTPERLNYPPGDWDYVGTVPARGENVYNTVVSTLCDSTDTGICYSTFFVSAVTTDPLTYFDSAPASGYSVDNLAPAPPTNVVLDAPDHMAWDEAPETDVRGYQVFASPDPTFDGTDSLIGNPATPEMPLPEWARGQWIFVRTVDFSGNASAPGGPPVWNATDAPILQGAPRFALERVTPSPFAANTMISFALPREARTTIRIFDVRGRLVRTLQDGGLSAGRYSRSWDGDDDSGARMGSGVYFVRMEAGGFVATRRVIYLR